MIANTIVQLEQVRERAARIRRNWSANEKRRRRGLPPDAPIRLREFILAPRAAAWPSNACR